MNVENLSLDPSPVCHRT